MKLAIALALLGVGACDRVYGLTGRGDDVTDAGPAIHVTGTFTRTYVLTDAAHAPVMMVTKPDDTDRPVVTSFGAAIPVEWNVETGDFAFDASVPYEVAIGASEWQSRAPQIAIDDVQFGRPSAATATSVTLDVALASPPLSNRQWDVISTGVWTRTPITFSASGTAPFIWTSSNFYGLAPRLLSSAAGDALFLATYAAGPLSGSLVLTELAQSTIEMREGTQGVTFGSQVLGPVGCTHVVPTSAKDLERLRDTYDINGDPMAGWEIDAVPAAELGVRVPHMLFNRYSPAGDNEGVDVAYASPYAGFEIVLAQVSSVTRVLGDAPLQASAVYQVRTTPSSPCPIANTGGNAALPVNAMLAGVPLSNDNLTLGVGDDVYAELTWQTTGDQPDQQTVELFEAPTTGPLVPIRAYVTGEPSVRIAKELLENGKRYVTRISTRSGRPGTSAGDFTRRELPSWAGVAFTSAFTPVQ